MGLSNTGDRAQLELHPSWPDLTDRQRKAINELWDEMVVPALEAVGEATKRRDDALLEAQDARGGAEMTWQKAEARARIERDWRKSLHAEVAALRTRVLELEQGISLSDLADPAAR